MSNTTETVSVAVTFTTSTPYKLPPQKYLIPNTWKRYQLSQLINKALSLENPVPFDFLIKNGDDRGWLRGSIANATEGTEETVELEYVESVLPPQKLAEIPQDEWISDIKMNKAVLFSSSYDGTVRTYDYSQQPLSSTHIHDAPITSLCIIPSQEENSLIATASHDLTGRITKISKSEGESQSLASLHLHTAALSSICSNSTGSLLLTSSWDSLIGVWDTSIPDTDEVPLPQDGSRKRRKLNAQTKRKAPIAVLKSHTSRVSDVQFNGNDTAVSCGFDSTIRSWDVEKGLCDKTITASEKPFLALCCPSESGTVLAASSDRTVTMYDLRSSLSTSILTLSHSSTPSCLASSGNQVLTGGYDGAARLWDLRGGSVGEVSSFKVWPDNKKILSLDLDAERQIVALGGEGGIALWRMSKETSTNT